MEASIDFINSDVESLVDEEVYRHTLKQLAYEAIVMPKVGNNSITTINDTQLQKLQFSECEISPFNLDSIDCSEVHSCMSERRPSVNAFAPCRYPIEQIKQLLVSAFASNAYGRRPYPSAGALYAVEPLIFLFQEGVEEAIQPGCYHFRARSKRLQKIKALSHEHFFSALLQDLIPRAQRPSFALVYLLHINKAIFKYRYRGYRHAVMEVGSMFQQATLCAQALGIASTVWSSYADYELLHHLNLDPLVFMPLSMQLFGKRK